MMKRFAVACLSVALYSGSAAFAAGKPVELIFSEFYNHFEMMDDFGNPYGSVSAAALRQAGAK